MVRSENSSLSQNSKVVRNLVNVAGTGDRGGLSGIADRVGIQALSSLEKRAWTGVLAAVGVQGIVDMEEKV
jgi:hypothetical protein